MLDLRDPHRRALRRSVDLVSLVHDDQWQLPTPCAQWTLRQLVEHMTSENRGFAAAARGETEDRSAWTYRSLADDLRTDYARSADEVVAAFGADGVLDREFWLPLIIDTMRFPAPQAISFHLLDYVVHGWDVAAALGHPLVIEDELVEVTIDIAEREVPDTPRRERPGASFRPPVPVPADASKQDRMLAMLGRSPRWPS
jgi:uncharacterized protein (TIGR03086 family)